MKDRIVSQRLALKLLAFACRVRPSLSLVELCGELSIKPESDLCGELKQLHATLPQTDPGYGAVPFGTAPYGGTRRVSDGKSSVPRRVTINGQVSYRGRMYSIGRDYAARTCMVFERGTQLLMLFHDRRPLYVTKR